MVKNHLNKKRIRLERMKGERMILEEQSSEGGQKQSNKASEEFIRSENEAQPTNNVTGDKVDVPKDDRTENGKNKEEDLNKIQDLNQEESMTYATEVETGNGKVENNMKETGAGNPEAEQNNDVTSCDLNLNGLIPTTTTTITTTVDPKQDQCILNSTDYYLLSAREQRIRYKGLITIKGDPSPLNDKASNNEGSVKTRSEKSYQRRSALKENVSVKRCDNIGDENLIGDGRGDKMTIGVKLGPVRQRKARVLEVRKDTRAEPRVRERSSGKLINHSVQQLNNLEKRKENCDDNHSGISTNLSPGQVTTEAQPNDACVTNTIQQPDPNNRTVCVLASLRPPKQADRSGRQTGLITLSVTSGHKARKPKSHRPLLPLPAITENEERGPLRKQSQDHEDEDRDVRNMRDLMQPSKVAQSVTVGDQKNAQSFLPPLIKVNGKFEKRSDVSAHNKFDILPRLTRSLDFMPGYLEHEEDMKTTADSTQSLTAVELNNLRRKKIRKMRKKILDKETVTVYQKNSKGQVVPSGVPFRRNVFAPPSDCEGRIRKRLVEAEQSVARQQKERMDTFFTQMVETGGSLCFLCKNVKK